MKKWYLSLTLIFGSIAVILWAVSPLLITYAQVLPADISFDIGNKESIQRAILQAEHHAIEDLRNLHGRSVFAVSILAILNALIAVFFIFGKKDKK